jgi:hypothetical protein
MRKETGFIKLHNDTYNLDTFIFVGSSSDYLSLCKRSFNIDEEQLLKVQKQMEGVLGFTISIRINRTTAYAVYLPRFDKNDIQSLGTLAHEMLHVAIFMLADKKVKVNFKGTTEELNYLFTEIYESALQRLSIAQENVVLQKTQKTRGWQSKQLTFSDLMTPTLEKPKNWPSKQLTFQF